MQEIMTSVEGLTCQDKNARIHLGGCGIQLVSKKDLLTRTPALHLLAAHAGESSSCITLSSSSSSVSSSSMQDQTRAPPQPPQREREVENLPPRRPLKLAPLELPTKVREAQRQKIKLVEQRPRKPKVCWKDKSPERYPLSILTEPLKSQQRATGAVNQLKPGSDRSTGGEEVGRVESNPTIKAKSHPSSLCQNNRPTQVYPARAPENSRQSAVPSRSQDAVKRRMRLRRSDRLEEDQSKSSSSTGGLSADEGKTASDGPGKGQGFAEWALRDTGHVLEKTSWKQAGAVGKVGRMMDVDDMQEAVL
ncbi:uncharacterized protein LOC130566799 [Triplophysa rosa]|uniref:Uncharacterized protein n=1 Tax=Triplophysa rosa TaxID=992332 RepID=A0A9W7TJL3_TRIRA|nr:uncharacterized protein LOC130566799 [Triplophysa rosa]KAI7798492.1 hypothetical protein IRJ41_004084 [Triplophysa rosa]